MLCDIYRKFSSFNKLSKYTYVGFGGIAFSDFILFHKSLGISDMISIEEDPREQKRLDFNKPFNAIKIICKHSSLVLPSLQWERPHIIWLDYDDPLVPEMFADISTVANHALSGTAFTFSFQCQRAPETEPPDGISSIDAFISNFGRDRVPLATTEQDLFSWKYGNLGQRMLLAEIEANLANRNARLNADEKLSFKKICSIQYNDNANMHTVVGMFVSQKDEGVFAACEFQDLNFLTRDRMIKIEVPPLTLREIRSLERQLPLNMGGTLDRGAIPDSEAKKFQKLYTYLPNFSVLEN